MSDPFAPTSDATAPVPSPVLAPIPVSTPVSDLTPAVSSGDAKAVTNSEVVPAPVPAATPNIPATLSSALAAQRVPDLDVPSPPTHCEVHVGGPAPRCLECVPGLLVCSSHLVECGGEGLIACSFCLRVCCSVHLYCPCDRAAARRLYVTTEVAREAAVGASKAARKAMMAVSAAQ